MRRILAITMAAAVLLAACSGGDAGETTEMAATEATTMASDDGGEVSDDPPESERNNVDVDLDVADGRQVIRRVSLELHAADTRATYDEIVAMVESSGGFVANADVHPTSGEDEQPSVSMTLRIPVDRLNETLSEIKESADEVVAESQGAEDVTEQFIDLEARLTNLEALEIELRALLEEVRMQNDADPEKLLTVFNELSSVRGQIEQIQGQLNYLDDATSLATVDVHLTQTPSTTPIVEDPWSPAEATRGAVRNLVSGLQGVADWTINFALYALPMLLITVGPLVVIGVLVYRRWLRKPAEVEPAEG